MNRCDPYLNGIERNLQVRVTSIFVCFSVARRCGFYFLPKERAQMAAVRGTASMTPMELATAEMASRLM